MTSLNWHFRTHGRDSGWALFEKDFGAIVLITSRGATWEVRNSAGETVHFGDSSSVDLAKACCEEIVQHPQFKTWKGDRPFPLPEAAMKKDPLTRDLFD